MTYWLIGNEEPGDPRFRQAGPAACGLYHMAGAWCHGEVRYRPEHDIPPEWFIPDWWVKTWPNGARLAGRLVHTGLWVDAGDGYYFGWIQPENTADHVRSERKRQAVKKARQRAKNPYPGSRSPQGTYRGDIAPENGTRDSRMKREQGHDQEF